MRAMSGVGMAMSNGPGSPSLRIQSAPAPAKGWISSSHCRRLRVRRQQPVAVAEQQHPRRGGAGQPRRGGDDVRPQRGGDRLAHGVDQGHVIGVERRAALLPVEAQQAPRAVAGAEDGPELVVVPLGREELPVPGAADRLLVGRGPQAGDGDRLAGQVPVEDGVLDVELPVPERRALPALDARRPPGRRGQQRGRVDAEPQRAVEGDGLSYFFGDRFEQLVAVLRLPARPLHPGGSPVHRHTGQHGGRVRPRRVFVYPSVGGVTAAREPPRGVYRGGAARADGSRVP